MNQDDASITFKIRWWVQPLLSALMIPVRLKILPDDGDWFTPFRDFIFQRGIKRTARRKIDPRDPRPVDIDEIEADD